jgi:hypothetical protein
VTPNELDHSKIKETTIEWNAYALVEKKVDALMDYDEMAPSELIAEGRRITMIRLSDFGVRAYSLNLIVNDAAWADPAKRAIADKIVDAVQEGYNMVRERPADAATHFSDLFPRLAPRFVDRSMVTVAQQLSGPPTGIQTRAGWEATIKTLENAQPACRADHGRRGRDLQLGPDADANSARCANATTAPTIATRRRPTWTAMTACSAPSTSVNVTALMTMLTAS